jgi:hypothetical protein
MVEASRLVRHYQPQEDTVPRTKQAPAGMELPAEKPAGLTDEQWRIGRAIGNLSLACRLIDVTDGDDAPRDETEVTTLLTTARDLENRAFNRYRRLRESLGDKLAAAQRDYRDARQRMTKLGMLLDEPDALVKQRAQADTGMTRAAPPPVNQVSNETPKPLAGTPSTGQQSTHPERTATAGPPVPSGSR